MQQKPIARWTRAATWVAVLVALVATGLVRFDGSGGFEERSLAMPGAGPGTDLVMVTPNGTFASGDDAAKQGFFQGLGWTVTAIDDSSSPAALAAAASANSVMFLSDTISDPALKDNVRGLDIGLVVETFGPKGGIMYGSQNEGFTSETTIRIVDTSHYITSPFTTGTLTIYSSSSDVNYWESNVTALPAGVAVLADRTTNADHETLFYADTGATLYSANTAPNRRVFIPSDAAPFASWNADYRTLVERSLDWAASNDAVCTPGDSDADGLQDCAEDANTDADFNPSTNPAPNTDGDANANYLDADDDGDGIPTISENADPNGDGYPQDAVDADKDGQPDYLDDAAGGTSGGVTDLDKISDTEGNLTTALDDADAFGYDVTTIGDLDGDGVNDLAVGAYGDDDGASSAGAVYVLFMNANGTVKTEQKISMSTGGGPTLAANDDFGLSVATIGDVDGDGTTDLLVGAPGRSLGSAFVLFMNTDGTARDTVELTAGSNGVAAQPNGGRFGWSVAGLGDLDGDGIPDIAVGDDRSDQGGFDQGAVYIFFLNIDGTVKAEQEISGVAGGFVHTFLGDEELGGSLAALGDVNGDGVEDLAVGAVRTYNATFDQMGGVHILFLDTDGTVDGQHLITETSFPYQLQNSGWFGGSTAGLGDIDGDGVPDLAIAAEFEFAGATAEGVVYVTTLNADGTVKTARRIDGQSNLLRDELEADSFGSGLANLGDLDGDGLTDLAVGAENDDDGGANRGAIYLVELCEDSDGDGLCDDYELFRGDTDGDTTPDHLDTDDDGDGTPTLSENADPNDDGDPRDAQDRDRDGEPDYLDAPTGQAALLVTSEQKISDLEGDLGTGLVDSDNFGAGAAPIGDLDSDGVVDFIVGASGDDDGGPSRGAVHILFMNANGTVRSEQKISDSAGGLLATLADGDAFGEAVAGIGDLNGDGIPDVAVGADEDDTGGGSNGALYILLLNTDGTVQAEQKIAQGLGGLGATLGGNARFGRRVSNVGDLDGDGINDLAVGAIGDTTNGSFTGAVYILFMRPDGTVRAEQKITHGVGGLTATIAADDTFGSVAGLGDVDGDGIEDLAVGAYADDDGGSNRGAVHILFLNSNGTVKDEQKISDLEGGFTTTLDDSDFFGIDVGGLGDIDNDGVPDLAVGATYDDDGASNGGAIYILTLNANGTVKAEHKVSEGVGGMTGQLDTFDLFGISVSGIGDLEGDGSINLLVGSPLDDDGGSGRGAVFVLNLAPLNCTLDSDADGLQDCQEDANSDADFNPSTNPGPNTDGDANPNYLDADDDGDGTPTLSENADPNSDGDPQDAQDRDRDGQPDYLDVEAGPSTASVADEQKISATAGNLMATIDDFDNLGQSLASIGDIDGDGVDDIAVGAIEDDDGGPFRGAVYILFLNTDGTVKAEQKISDTAGNFGGTLDDVDRFGHAVAALGDLDGDGTNDIAVGTWADQDGGPYRGGLYVLFLNPNGTVKAEQKISDTAGGLAAALDDYDYFGGSLAGLGDVDGDGINDMVAGAWYDDDGGADRGAAYILFLNADGTVKAEQKISDTAGGLAVTLGDNDLFGAGLGAIGDLDGDGITELAVSAVADDDGGADRGAVHVLFLNADGTVKAEQKISDLEGGLTTALIDDAGFGRDVAGVGDIDGNGLPDIVAGSWAADGAGVDRGGIYLISLNADGTVLEDHLIDDALGGLTGPLDDSDRFGIAVTGLGDLDGDGGLNLAVGARYDDDGGSERGAAYILDLRPRLDSDGDGLWDHHEDDDTDLDRNPTSSPGPNTDGDANPNYLDADDDDDGTPTISENPDPNGDGNPRDARDTDHDGQPDYLDNPSGPTAGSVGDEQKISDLSGNLTAALADDDRFGQSSTALGDLDGDGVVDLAVGAVFDDDGGPDRGAVYILFLNADGTVKAEQKISSTQGGLTGPLDDNDHFGIGADVLGDLDGDGLNELLVGARYDGDGATSAGAVYVLFLNPNGTVRAEQKISNTSGGFGGTLSAWNEFGDAVAGIGDIDGDGVMDAAVGAHGDGDGGSARGAVWVLLLNPDGTVKAEQKISSTQGGLTGPLDDGDELGVGVDGVDLDGDGRNELVVGSFRDDDGGTDAGAMYVLFLNADGTVASEQKVSPSVGGLTGVVAGDSFGSEIVGIGDLNLDGVPDLAVGAPTDGDGGATRGAVHILTMNANGTVAGNATISSTLGDFTGPLADDDRFGTSLAGLGDLDGDGTINIAVGVDGDDDGGSNRGAVYILDLSALPVAVVVNSTGDAADLTPGDQICDTGGTIAGGDPECTLRAAIEETNVSAANTIDFAIPGAGPTWTISPATVLPDVTAAVAIDGTSQPGYASTPVIQVDGTALSLTTEHGLALQPGSDGSVIQGLSITDFPGAALRLRGSDDHLIVGNLLGLDPDGSTIGANRYGIYMSGSSNTVIGGDTAAERNVMSGNTSWGVAVYNDIGLSLSSLDTTITGNYIGTDATGMLDRGNGSQGVFVVNGSSRTAVGGSGAGQGNVIAANGSGAVYVGTGSMVDSTVTGNLIGVAADGITALANSGYGVSVASSQRTVVADNVILATDGEGITLSAADDAVITGNHIGTDASQTVTGSIAGAGILIGSGSDRTTIGATAGVDANVITNATGAGVAMTAGTEATILGNAIHTNGGLGIDLGDDDVTVNDAGDVDTGVNDLLNHPAISRAEVVASMVTVDMNLDVPSGDYRIEIFANPSGGDTTGYGEGESLVHTTTITHTGTGIETFSTSFTGSAGMLLSATATEDLGGSYGVTSELSQTEPVVAPDTVVVNSTGDAGDTSAGDGVCDTGGTNVDGAEECTLRAAIEEANASATVDIVHFDVPVSDPGYVAGLIAFWRIEPGTILPNLWAEGMTLDATTQLGGGTIPRIVIDGNNLSGTESGIRVDPNADDSVVRGFSVVSFPSDGIIIGVDRVLVERNHFGVMPDGVTGAGNGSEGVVVWSGVDTVIADNMVGDNAAAGIGITDDADRVTLTGNIIGTDATGTADLGNAQALWTNTTGAFTFGGTGAGDGNVAANNGFTGLDITGAAQVSILGNEIRDNGMLGINLNGGTEDAFGVTVNDAGDADTGPNNLLNHPVLRSAVLTGTTTVSFDLDVPAGDYRIEFFDPGSPDPSGHGEGAALLGFTTVTSSGSGDQSFSATVTASDGQLVTATATEESAGPVYGVTSEFSNIVTVSTDLVVVDDASVRRSDLSPAGGVDPAITVAGVAGQALSYDGSDDRLVAPATDLTSGELTMSAWFNATSFGTDPRLLAKAADATTPTYELFIDDLSSSTGTAVARIRLDGTTYTAAGGFVATGAWHHVAATWDGTNLVLYVDGVAVDTTPAAGTLATDLTVPLTVANLAADDRGLTGIVDEARVFHAAHSGERIAAESANISAPAATVTVGARQTEASGAWSVTTARARSGTNAVAAPPVTAGAGDAWLTAIGIDEPGVEFESWWWFSTATGVDIAAGTRTGPAPTDQYETALASPTGWDLATVVGAGRTVDSPAAGSPVAGQWVRVVIRTDDAGTSSVWIDGVQVVGPTSQGSTLTQGSIGLRVGELGVTEEFVIDDARARKLVAIEPTTTVGPLDRR